MGTEARLNPFSKEHKPPVEGVLDLRGRALQAGDEIMLTTGQGVLFRVVAITPVLDPQAPRNLLKVEIAAVMRWHAANGQVSNEFIRVRTAEEAGPMDLIKAAGDKVTP